MFKKKPTEEEISTTVEDTRKAVLKDKDDNYKVSQHSKYFLKLVRDKEYDDAYRLGRLILKANPDNPAIAKFCLFIEQNNVERTSRMNIVKKMVDEEKEYAEYTTDSYDSEEEGGSDKDEYDEDEEEESYQSDSVSESESESDREKSKEKKSRSPQRLCDVHEWPHVCKNPDCPNKRPK